MSKFKVGDKVKCMSDIAGKGSYNYPKHGDVSTIIDKQGSGIYLDNFVGWGFFSEIYFDLVEEVKPDTKFKIGDRVRVIEEYYPYLVVGEVGEVCYENGNSIVSIQSEDPSYGDGKWTVDDYKLELIEDKIVLDFKLGDRVIITVASSDSGLSYGTVGTISKVDTCDEEDLPYLIDTSNGSSNWASAGEIELYEEDSEVLTEAKIVSEFADDVVITARYSIEIKANVIEDLNFSELCVLRDALNNIVGL